MNRSAARPLRSVMGAISAGCLAAGSALAAGNPDNGAAIVANRSQGLCTLCHAVPGQPPALQGTLGPPLAGVGARLDAAQLRDRLLAPERFNPDTVMPSYGRSSFADADRQRVAPALRGKPLLTPPQVDDVVAYLAGLR